MVHNQDEIRELDGRILELHRLLEFASETEVITTIENVMRFLVWHDWPEWALSRQWHVPDDTFDSFDADDAEFIRRFTIGVVTVLKSNGQSGVKNLQSYAATYLQQRGIRTDRPSPETVSVKDVAKFLKILRTSIPKVKVLAWGTPVRGNGKKGSPHEWMRLKLLPILKAQWPDQDWSKF